MFKLNDWIILEDESAFVRMHHQNAEIAKEIRGIPLKVVKVDAEGDIRQLQSKDGKLFGYGIYRREQRECFRAYEKMEFGEFKIILTYIEDGKTIEEEGVTSITMTHETVEYKYNRKKLGFIKYKGEVKLKIDELKQITISTPLNERVYHIENGVIIREHIMYDVDRKFKYFKIGD